MGAEPASIPRWLGGLLCLLGGLVGAWRFSLAGGLSAAAIGFVVGAGATYVVIYHWTDRRGALRGLEECLTGAAFGGLALIGSTAFGPFTPVFGAIGGFVAVYLASLLWRALGPHGDDDPDRSEHTDSGGRVS